MGIVIFIMISNQMPFNENQPHDKILEIQKYYILANPQCLIILDIESLIILSAL